MYKVNTTTPLLSMHVLGATSHHALCAEPGSVDARKLKKVSKYIKFVMSKRDVKIKPAMPVDDKNNHFVVGVDHNGSTWCTATSEPIMHSMH